MNLEKADKHANNLIGALMRNGNVQMVVRETVRQMVKDLYRKRIREVEQASLLRAASVVTAVREGAGNMNTDDALLKAYRAIMDEADRKLFDDDEADGN